MEDNTTLDKYRRVAHVEEFYEIIRDVMKRMCYMVGTRRRLKRYGVMSPMCLLLNMYSCAQLQSLYHGIPRKICFSVPILSASETTAIDSSFEANHCRWVFLQIASKQIVCPRFMLRYFVIPDLLFTLGLC